MAGQNSWHRGTPKSREGERLRHAQVLPAKMGRSCLSHVWRTLTKTSLLWRAEGGQVLPRGTKKALQRLLEGVLEMLQHQPRLLGRSCARALCLAHLGQIRGVGVWDKSHNRTAAEVPASQEQTWHCISDKLGSSICLSILQPNFQSENWTHQPSLHPKRFEEVVVIFASEGRTTYKLAEMFWNQLYPTWSKEIQSFTLSSCVSLSLVKVLKPCRQDAPVSHGSWKVKLKYIGVVWIYSHKLKYLFKASFFSDSYLQHFLNSFNLLGENR